MGEAQYVSRSSPPSLMGWCNWSGLLLCLLSAGLFIGSWCRGCRWIRQTSEDNGLGWPDESNGWGPYQCNNNIIISSILWIRKTRFCSVIPAGLGEHPPCNQITCLCAESPHGRRNFSNPQISCGLVFMFLDDRLQSTKGPNPMEVVNGKYQKDKTTLKYVNRHTEKHCWCKCRSLGG